YTERLGLILIDGGRLDDGEAAALAASGVQVIECAAADISLGADHLLVRQGGREFRFDSAYPALGMEPRSQLAHDAGARLGPDDRLVVSPHMMTSIAGLYAAGDMVRGLNQISIAQAEGAIAATDIHNRLRRLEREGGQRAAA
ncbi:MAG: FAD-dependent oxidoreductase, partial [Pseudomonadota bacterium]|nr:FAD-dependent oxidoreductase [Pseudomonadota bacterium]